MAQGTTLGCRGSKQSLDMIKLRTFSSCGYMGGRGRQGHIDIEQNLPARMKSCRGCASVAGVNLGGVLLS